MFARPRSKKSLLPPPAKRRKTNSTIGEISFDFDARADYLTGFRKRKVQRSKQAQEEAAKKEKDERIARRKRLREERQLQLEAHVEAVNALLADVDKDDPNNEDDSDDEPWGGILDSELLQPVDHEAEYIDEDRYTTVTVEEVDVSKEGFHKVIGEEKSYKETKLPYKGVDDTTESLGGSSKKVWPRKTRKKKFRYESKAERKVTRGKQKAGNKVKADARRGAT